MAEGNVNYRHWLHQVYEQRWKGTVVIETVAGPLHAVKNPQWCCTLTASGAVVQDKNGKNVTLEPLSGEAEARTKREAEHQAAKQVYDALVEQGLYDPSKPYVKTSGGVSRAGRFITDNVPANEHNPLAYLDVSIDGKHVGRIVLELFRYKKGTTLEQHAPLAVDNFLALCRGVEVGSRKLCYAGVPVTRIMQRYIIQAGDVVNRDGTGAAHIHTAYGENFPDEGLNDKNYRFAHPFMLACANRGLEDTNSSQFFITLAPAAQLAGQHTCFGKVLAGFGVVKEIESLGDSVRATPPCPVLIAAAGELPPGSAAASTPPVSGGGWPLWAEDQGPPPEGVREAAFRLDIAQQLKEAGNQAYKQGDAGTALARYQQAARFLSWPSFKLRDPSGDVDLDYDEQRALWDGELLLWGNAAAAQLKLGQYRQALSTCQGVLQRSPRNVKVLLRAAQATIGLGPGEYSAAAQLLQQALEHAKEQQLPIRDIVAEMHRLRDLQKQHGAKLRSKFSAAFQSGMLHHPADDQQAAASTAAGAASHSEAAAAAAAAGLRHVVVSPERRVPGPVPVERVLYNAQPVMLQDAWGSHLLLADDDAESEEHEDTLGAAAPTSYSRGLMARLQKLGLVPRSEEFGVGGYDSEEEGNWWADRTGTSEDGDEELAGQQQQQQQCKLVAPAGASSTALAGATPDTAVSAVTEHQANGSTTDQVANGKPTDGSNGYLADADSVAAVADPAEAGVPEEHEAQQVAAAGMTVCSGVVKGQARYGDGALDPLPVRVPLK